jgi:hypothetical protein
MLRGERPVAVSTVTVKMVTYCTTSPRERNNLIALGFGTAQLERAETSEWRRGLSVISGFGCL